MALFKRGISGGLMNVIRCDEEEYLVWKWRPRNQCANTTTRENSIRYGSSLRVKDGEVAVFVYKQNDETAQDFVVGPYDQILKTANLPVLSSIVGLAYGGDTPFQAEVYFINLQRNNQISLVVPYFDVTDPRLPDHPVPVAVHGVLTFSLEDYKAFIKLNRLKDFDLDEFMEQIEGSVVRKVKSVVANTPSDLSIPVVQIERQIDTISSVLEVSLQECLAEFGVRLKRLDIQAIIVDKESKAYAEVKALTAGITAKTLTTLSDVNLKNMREMQQVNRHNLSETMRINREERQRAQRLQSESTYIRAHAIDKQADVLKTAASKMGQMGTMPTGATGGMNPAEMMTGMMMGGALGGQMAGMVSSMGQQMQNAVNTPPPMPDAPSYMLAVNGQQMGPFSIDQLQQMAMIGQLTSSTYVWKPGMEQWEVASAIPELAMLFAPATPQTPPTGMCPPPPPQS